MALPASEQIIYIFVLHPKLLPCLRETAGGREISSKTVWLLGLIPNAFYTPQKVHTAEAYRRLRPLILLLDSQM